MIELEKTAIKKWNEETDKDVNVGDAKEIGTCKYCDECFALKDMKAHYLSHLDKEDTDTKIIKTEEDEEYNCLLLGEYVSIVWLDLNPSQKLQLCLLWGLNVSIVDLDSNPSKIKQV